METAAPVESRATVYVVEPDEQVRESLRALLEELGAVVEDFASAEALLAQAMVRPPACIVSEVLLPRMSGLELLRQIRTTVGQAVPLVFVSSQSDIPTVVRAVRLGAVDFFAKPVIGQDLVERVRWAVEWSRAYENGTRPGAPSARFAAWASRPGSSAEATKEA